MCSSSAIYLPLFDYLVIISGSNFKLSVLYFALIFLTDTLQLWFLTYLPFVMQVLSALNLLRFILIIGSKGNIQKLKVTFNLL